MKKAFSLIEILVAMGIFLILAGSATTAILGSYRISRKGGESSKATELAVEGIEAVQSLKNESWDNLVDGPHGLDNTGGSWAFLDTSELIDNKYTRIVTISSVERDVNGDIVSSGGTTDADTKQITSTVNWDFNPGDLKQVQLVSYLTNWGGISGIAPGNVGGGGEVCGNGTCGTGEDCSSCSADCGACVPTTCAEWCVSAKNYSGGVCKSRCGGSQIYVFGWAGDNYCSGAQRCCCNP